MEEITLQDALAELEAARLSGTKEALNSALESCTLWLLDQPTDHYFCSRLPTDALHVSAYCLRLSEFKPKEHVSKWRQNVDNVLDNCVDCVDGYLRAKRLLADKYLRLQNRDQAWLSNMLVKEAAAITERLQDSNSIFRAPFLHHILSQPAHYKSHTILGLLRQQDLLPSLTKDQPIPAGLLDMAFSPDDFFRSFALAQLKGMQDIQLERYDDPALAFNEALATHFEKLRNGSSTNKEADWASLHLVLGKFTPAVITSAKFRTPTSRAFTEEAGSSCSDLVRLICADLGSVECHFLRVLECFALTLRKCRFSFWAKDDLAFPSIVQSMIMDNKAFEAAVDGDADVLGWMKPFLQSIPTTSVAFRPAYSTFLSFLLSTLQAPRFSVQSRCTAVKAGIELLELIFLRIAIHDVDEGVVIDAWQEADLRVLEVHSATICNVAFAAPFAFVPLSHDKENPDYQRRLSERQIWAPTSRSARNLLQRMLAHDAGRFNASTTAYLSLSAQSSTSAQAIEASAIDSIRYVPCAGLWKTALDTINNVTEVGRLNAAEFVFKVAAETAYFSRPDDIAFLQVGKDHVSAFRTLLKPLQKFFDACVIPWADLLRELAESGPSKVRGLLAHHVISSATVKCLFSPQNDLHSAMLAITGEAYEASSRSEACQQLFRRFPVASLEASSAHLARFVQLAQSWPDVVSCATRTARCLYSIMEVLGDTQSGLLRDVAWITTPDITRRLKQLWRESCSALAVIFARTPGWSRYHQNDVMTAWMRDVIGFANMMMSEFRAFESALRGVTTEDSSPAKLTSAGSGLVNALAQPMANAISWLRLTDEEMLTSTVALLVRMISRFARANVSLPTAVVDKLAKYSKPDNRKGLQQNHVNQLVLALQRHPAHAKAFEDFEVESDEEVDVPKESPNLPLKSMLDRQRVTASSKRPATDPIGKDTRRENSLTAPASVLHIKSAGSSTKPIVKSNGIIPAAARAKLKGPTFAQPVMRSAPKLNYSHAKMAAAIAGSSSDSEGDARRQPEMLLAPPTKVRKLNEGTKVKMYDGSNPTRLAANGRSVLAPLGTTRQLQNAALARSNPDMLPLYRTILQWDYKHQGAVPAYTSAKKPEKLRDRYKDTREYTQYIQPLLELECWSQLQQVRDEFGGVDERTCSFVISGRQSVDQFVELFMSLKPGQRLSDKWFYTDADLVLLRQDTLHLLGKIHSTQRRGDSITLTIRCHLGIDSTGIGPRLVTRSEWRISKVMSLSTLLREYAALQTLPYLDLMPDILRPRLQSPSRVDAQQVDRIKTTYHLNLPQAQAVCQALGQEGFTLIQGPPGTGKTSTILALVGALCSKLGAIPSGNNKSREPARLLLCAPSNAAIDEIARRLKEGIFSDSARRFVPNIVRIGAESSVNIAVKDLFLDQLIEKEMGNGGPDSKNDALSVQISSLRVQLDALKVARLDAQNKLESMGEDADTAAANNLKQELRSIRKDVQQKTVNLQEARDKQQQTVRAVDVSKRKLRIDILSRADVLCTTLSGAGHEYLLGLPFNFETVIIDEAAQAVELSSLIPLKYGCRRCVMVGDPQQLPPTVLSVVASEADYGKSLFRRMQEQSKAEAVHLLSIQYRMHPKISAFPSRVFYESRLQDGPKMADVTARSWHNEPLLVPFSFLHVKDGREERRSNSIMNKGEASAILALYEALSTFFDMDAPPTIGIIATYKAQLTEIKNQFRYKYGQQVFGSIDFNTVDGFQGQEKDIIMVSCVRGGPTDTGIGFLSDQRRMNVAITRARSNLFVFGNSRALSTNKNWGGLVDHARANKCYQDQSPLHIDASAFKFRARVQQQKSRGSDMSVEESNPAKKAKPSPQKQDIKLPEGLVRPQDVSKNKLAYERAKPPIAKVAADSQAEIINSPERKATYVRPEKRKAASLAVVPNPAANGPDSVVSETTSYTAKLTQAAVVPPQALPQGGALAAAQLAKAKPSLFLPKKPKR